ncbi:MAG: hypothetical protein CM15mV46_180 [Caudoviricetes sp.]|nr:MAG: hypothetical protein CM15mV46_180 [Caudoviricetes sp.]
MADTVTVVGIQFKTFEDAKVKKAFRQLGREVGSLKRILVV